jgi:hypothetical protein
MNRDDKWDYTKSDSEGKALEDFQEHFIERYRK